MEAAHSAWEELWRKESLPTPTLIWWGTKTGWPSRPSTDKGWGGWGPWRGGPPLNPPYLARDARDV